LIDDSVLMSIRIKNIMGKVRKAEENKSKRREEDNCL